MVTRGYNVAVEYPETRQSQARRWAKFPATVLFALSVVWLLRSFFYFLANPGQLSDLSHTGVGVLQIVWDMLVIPVGGAVIGIYLLLRKRWAAPVAALIPLWPLLLSSSDKLARVLTHFHLYNQTGLLREAGSGVTHLLTLAAFWVLYGLMLAYLWKVWNLLRTPRPWGTAAGEAATFPAARVPPGSDSEVCFLLPETDDAESA